MMAFSNSFSDKLLILQIVLGWKKTDICDNLPIKFQDEVSCMGSDIWQGS